MRNAGLLSPPSEPHAERLTSGSPVLGAWPAGLLRGVVPAALVGEAGIVVRDGEIRPLSSRTPVVEHGATRVRPVTSDVAEQWLASVWVRDLDGRGRLVQARRPGRREAEPALEQRLAHRHPLGIGGLSRT